jgi:DNA-binding transcriptional MerR regulator
MSEFLSIRDAAQTLGLSGHTLRYYEQIGLIPSVSRNGGGHRSYSRTDLDWIRFLICLKATGMGISEMQAFAELRMQGEISVPARRRLLEVHRAQLQERLRGLREHLDVLEAKIEHYEKLEANVTPKA